MTCAKFESVIGFHCSPVLLGIKPANLVSLVKDDAGMPAASLMQHYKRKLAKHGVSILPLCERERTGASFPSARKIHGSDGVSS